MPRNDELLIDSMTELAQEFGQVAKSLQILADKVEGDRRFRRWVTAGLIVGLLAVSFLSIHNWYEFASERREACARQNSFRRDLHSGVDSVLDAITQDADPAVQSTVSEAKQAIREKVPLNDC